MKILVVSGFLGAGKTTFIRTLAERTKKDFAVMENEYGAVNVDGDLLEQTNDLNIWELTEGCICFAADGSGFIIEGHGVDPDILLENDPYLEFNGEDQQLNKAIEVILEKLKTEKKEVPAIPEFPVK